MNTVTFSSGLPEKVGKFIFGGPFGFAVAPAFPCSMLAMDWVTACIHWLIQQLVQMEERVSLPAAVVGQVAELVAAPVVEPAAELAAGRAAAAGLAVELAAGLAVAAGLTVGLVAGLAVVGQFDFADQQ